MAIFSDDPFDTAPKKAPVHEIGQNLDALSVHELDERAAILRAEIHRIDAKKQSKLASKSAADQFFKS